jgi:hypothetical protein
MQHRGGAGLDLDQEAVMPETLIEWAWRSGYSALVATH